MLSYGDIMGMIADPIVQTCMLAIIGALVTRVVLRDHPERRLVGQLIFFLALTGLLLYHGIVPYGPGAPEASVSRHILVGLAKIIWWVNAAWSLIGITRVFLIFERKPREGRLLQDLVVGIIYVSALLFVFAYVFNAPVGTLIATSGVFAIIVGLALQSTLSDVFSGIALNLSRPYGIGDWVVLGNGIEGKVVETNWRATHLLNGANDLVIVPNSDLAKARLTNLSSPERSHGVKLTVWFRPTTTPSIMADAMHSALLSSNSIMSVPEPTVMVTSLDGNAVGLELSFRVADLSGAGRARNEVFDLVYRHALAAGLALSGPSDGGAASLGPLNAEDAARAPRSMQLRLLDAVPLFASLTEDEKEVLASTMTRRTFSKGEVLVEQGIVLKSLLILRNGVATVTQRDPMQAIELGRLAPGDYFGEGGLLTNTGEPGTIRALTFVVAYEITQQGLAPLMRERPTIAEELGLILSRRSARAKHLRELGHAGESSEPAPSLTARIRHLFEV